MRITFNPHYSGVNYNYKPNHQPAFKSDSETWMTDNDAFKSDSETGITGNDVKNALLFGLSGSAVLCLVALLAADEMKKGDEIKAKDKFNSDLIELTTSDKFDQSKFEIKDFTGDEKPDLKLYNKDGSFVIVDIDNMEILQEKTDDKFE